MPPMLHLKALIHCSYSFKLKPMINRIFPKIKNGERFLLLSESVCFLMSEGLTINVPTTNSNDGKSSKDLVINFRFNDDNTNEVKSNIEIAQEGINISLTNFGRALPAGTTKPIGFTIGNSRIELLFIGHAVESKPDNSKVMSITLSVYQVAS